MVQQHKQALERIAAALEEFSAEIKTIQAKEKTIFETTPSGTMGHEFNDAEMAYCDICGDFYLSPLPTSGW